MATERIPDVSVIIPTRGRIALLADALASVRAQVGIAAAGVEIVVVQDGTPEDVPTRGLCERYGAAFHVKPHGGLSSAVNVGYAASRGATVTVLADDDTMRPEKLAALLAALKAEPRATLAFGLGVRVLHGQVTGDSLPKIRQWARRHAPVTWRTICEGHGCLIHGTATLHRRAAWEAVRAATGGWDESLRTAEEWEWHLRCLWQGGYFVHVPVVTDEYRVHAGQKSQRDRGPARRAVHKAISARYGKLVQEGAACSA